MMHFRKRDKTADMLFKIVEYGGIAFGVNAFLPESPITPLKALTGLGVLAVIYIAALFITPEKEET